MASHPSGERFTVELEKGFDPLGHSVTFIDLVLEVEGASDFEAVSEGAACVEVDALGARLEVLEVCEVGAARASTESAHDRRIENLEEGRAEGGHQRSPFPRAM
jgi:hypothetical protein